MTAPTFVSSTATAFNSTTSPKTTASISVQNGDVLVAFGMAESGAASGGSVTVAISTASGSTSAWALQEEDPNAGASPNQPYLRAWTATATATGTITVSFTKSGGTAQMSGGVVKVWRASGGIGNVNANNNGTVTSGTPTISITTTQANSALDFGTVDWNAVSGTATFTASNGTPVSDLVDQTTAGSNYCIYSQHVVDAGSVGSKTMGMSAPTGQRYVDAVIEVLGTSSSSSPVAELIVRGQAVKRASYW